MKIVICDYAIDLARDLDYEIAQLRRALPDPEIVVYEYKDDKQDLIRVLRDADAVIDTYVQLDREILSQTQQLKCIALNSVGYDTVDLKAASEMGILVCPAAEYCTAEVAEHAIALMMALFRGLRRYIRDIESHVWDYMAPGAIQRISGKTLAIFGFGKIGHAVAKRAQALGMQVLVVSQSLTPERAAALDLRLVDWQYAMEHADVLSNHMALKDENRNFFDLSKFELCKKTPIFLNTGRGGSVDETGLAQALDRGLISGAGLDVLVSENAEHLVGNPLLGRDNVIVTPHAGFYSVQAARDLQDIACTSVVGALTGQYDQISKIVNRTELKI